MSLATLRCSMKPKAVVVRRTHTSCNEAHRLLTRNLERRHMYCARTQASSLGALTSSYWLMIASRLLDPDNCMPTGWHGHCYWCSLKTQRRLLLIEMRYTAAAEQHAGSHLQTAGLYMTCSMSVARSMEACRQPYHRHCLNGHCIQRC